MLYSGRTLAVMLLACGGGEAFRISPHVGPNRAVASRPSVVMADVVPMDTSVTDKYKVDTKKNVRRQIMGADSYKRGSAPFDKTIHKDVNQKSVDCDSSRVGRAAPSSSLPRRCPARRA